MDNIEYFTIIGLISLAIGMTNIIVTVKFMRKSKVIEGTIQDFKEESTENGRTYYPIIKYFDEIASKYNCYESNTGYWKSRFKKGETVQLRYYCSRGKRKLSLNTWLGLWGCGFVFTLIGGLFTIIGFLS